MYKVVWEFGAKKHALYVADYKFALILAEGLDGIILNAEVKNEL